MSSRNKKNASSDSTAAASDAPVFGASEQVGGHDSVRSDQTQDSAQGSDTESAPEALDAGTAAPDVGATVHEAAPNLSSPAKTAPPDDAREREQEAIRMLQQLAQQTMGEKGSDADHLTEDERRYLESHLKANPLHQINQSLFADVQQFKQMTITFYNLRANSKAFLSIRPDQVAIWSEGGEASRMVGLSFATSTQSTLYLRNFLINAREMFLETYQDCTEISIGLYVRTEQHDLKGRVDLPPGASVTLRSRCDRSSIIGLSSFGIDLE